MADILGSGIAFPLQVDRRGGLALARDETDIDQAIELILGTAPGERPMRPEFGCGVHDFVFDTIDAGTVARMETEIRGALDRWEPRVEVTDVRVRPRRRRHRPAADPDRLPRPRDQPHAQPRLPLLRDPRRRMRLPEIQLDDRRFQDLISEARMRINRSCPEWTEHNVSDPGITLIELFAWMTEMTIYRLNRVPDKLHVALLELLGIRLDGPSAARTALRFRLAGPATEAVTILGGATEVGTPRTPTEESIIFQVDEDFTIPPARPVAYVVQRGDQFKDVGLADGEARPQGPDQLPFGSPPAVGDALYLGFEEPIGRLLMQVDVDASQARGTGVNPDDPPLRWEVSQGDGRWEEATVLEDLTGGFNYGAGTVELELPPRSAIEPREGHRLHWLRCRVDDRTRHGGEVTKKYTEPPSIYSITAAPIGARLPSTHASHEEREVVGTSDGTPGQIHPLRHRPVLKPHTRRDARGAGPRVRRLGDVGAARGLRRLLRARPPLRARPRERLGRARPRDPRDRRRLDAVRRGAAEGRGAALHRLPPRRRPPGQRHGGNADRAQERDPRRRHGHEPGPGGRRRRRRGHRARAPARVDGDPLAVPRGHRRGLRVPGRRGVAADRPRGLHPAEPTAGRCGCTCSRACIPPTASSPTTSCCPTRA